MGSKSAGAVKIRPSCLFQPELKDGEAMNIPIPAETPDPNLDDPQLPGQPAPPSEEPPPTMPPVVEPPKGDPPSQEPPAILGEDFPE